MRLLPAVATLGSLLVLTSGCSLADDYDTRELQAAVQWNDGGMVTVSVVLGREHGDDIACPSLPEGAASAEVNGVPLPLVRAGGWEQSRFLAQCLDARYYAVLAVDELVQTSPHANIRVTVGSTTMEMTVLSAFETRRLELGPDASPVGPASRLAVQLSPATDVLSSPGARLFVPVGEAQLKAYELPSELLDDTSIQVTLPADTPAGAAQLFVRATSRPAVGSCSGVSACSVDPDGISATIPIVVE
jgi:hypothetical protein